MKRLPNQPNNRNTAGSSPYQDLFVYYLAGRLQTAGEVFEDNFIGNWQEDDYSFLFFSSPAVRQIDTLLLSQPQLRLVDSYRMPYEQWLGESFGTFEHGKFRVIPPWETPKEPADPFDDKLQILLDPGLVFGTGTHPTTRNCLSALELACRPSAPETVLDLGTGTGLLALAAARLGSERIVAVDLNLLAAETAAANVRRNRLQGRIMVVQARAEDAVDYPADLLLANIHHDVMQHLIHAKGFLAKKKVILSGLLRSEAKNIVAELERFPLRISRQWTHDGIWHTFFAEKK